MISRKYGRFVNGTPSGLEVVGFIQIDPKEFYYQDLALAIVSDKYQPSERNLYAEKLYPQMEVSIQGNQLVFKTTDQGGGIGDVWVLVN